MASSVMNVQCIEQQMPQNQIRSHLTSTCILLHRNQQQGDMFPTDVNRLAVKFRVHPGVILSPHYWYGVRAFHLLLPFG